MHPTTRLALVATALAALAAVPLVPAPAWAQEEPAPVLEEEPADEVEAAFLRAQYIEVGKKDPAAALVAYEALLAKYPDHAITEKTEVCRARCLWSLGRFEELKAVLADLRRRFPDNVRFAESSWKIPAQTGGDAREDMRTLILASLRSDNWSKAVVEFGDRAVPVLDDLLRSADPSTVRRASQSLRSIGSPAASKALLGALVDEDVLYPGSLNRGLHQADFAPELGRGIVELEDTRLRDSLFLAAMYSRVPQEWMIDAIVAHEWARALAFPAERSSGYGISWILRDTVARGPGPARDAALRHVQLYSGGKQQQMRDPSPLRNPPPEFLRDREALLLFAKHVYETDFRFAPTPELRDALLAQPETRELALLFTVNYSIPCENRQLLVDALTTASWRIQHRNVYQLPSFVQPAPTLEEWSGILAHLPRGNPWALLQALEERGHLNYDVLEAFVRNEFETAVLNWLVRNGCDDGVWAARVVTPLLDHDDPLARVLAGVVVSRMHLAKTLNARPVIKPLARLVGEDAFWEHQHFDPILDALQEIGDEGTNALAAAVPDDPETQMYVVGVMKEREWSQTAALARRMILAPPREGDDPLPHIGVAVGVLRSVAGKNALPTLLEALQTPPILRAQRVLSQNWLYLLSSDDGEKLISAILERAPGEVRLPGEPGNLTAAAQRRVSLLGLASADRHAQQWGATWQKSLLDPAAATRLGELARSPVPSVRDAAREALASMRDAEEDLSWMRAVASRRATQERIDAYLRDGDPIKRMAGVAGLVALRAPNALDRLLDIAAKDADERVRTEARRALIALGTKGRDAGGGPRGAGEK